MDIISISDSDTSVESTFLVPLGLSTGITPKHKSSISNNELNVIAINPQCNKSLKKYSLAWTHSQQNPLNILSNNTLYTESPTSKVSSWLYKNAEQINQNIITFSEPFFEANKQLPPTKKSSILVRQDYKKNIGQNVLDQVNNNQHTSKLLLPTGNKGNQLLIEQTQHQDVSRSVTPHMQRIVESTTNLCNPQEGRTLVQLKDNLKPSDSVPLSPENQKKIELCQYLKLMNMNPIDKRTIHLQQNRRSSRVKNLALLTEKKELERKLNNISNEDKKKSVKSNLNLIEGLFYYN